MPDAITIVSDMKIYEDEFNAGAFEALFQNSALFNERSNNAIALITDVHQGNYQKRAYFAQISSLVVRQDITSTSSVDSKKLAQVEEIGVKVHRRIGPVQWTYKAFEMAGLQTPEGSMALGRLVGDAVLQNMASIAIISLNAAVGGQSALVHDITGETKKTAHIKALNRARAKWGDQMTKLATWVSHSVPYTDLVDDGIDVTLESVAGQTISTGRIGPLMNGSLVVSDNANLVNSAAPDTYNTLGLSPFAAVLKQSELQNVVLKVLTGFEQLIIEFQGEYAMTMSIDGFTYDAANGLANPTDATLGTTTNWDKVRTDTVGLPIVKLLSQ